MPFGTRTIPKPLYKIMKKLLLIIYLIPILIIAQEKKDAETQNNWYKKAKMELNELQNKKSFLFLQVCI